MPPAILDFSASGGKIFGAGDAGPDLGMLSPSSLAACGWKNRAISWGRGLNARYEKMNNMIAVEPPANTNFRVNSILHDCHSEVPCFFGSLFRFSNANARSFDIPVISACSTSHAI